MINAVTTKQGRKILWCIHDKGRVSSGEIADYLRTSKSSTSNALERLKNSEYPLVQAELEGRKKMYSLTDTAKEFLEYLMQNQGIKQQLSLEQEVRMNLKMLMNEDEDWQYVFAEYFAGQPLKDKKDTVQSMEDFLDMFWEFSQEDYDGAQAIYKGVPSNRCRKLLENYLDRRKGLQTLEEVLEEDWQEAYKIVDAVFSGKSILEYADFFEKADSYQMSSRDYYAIFIQLSLIIHEADKDNLDKERFFAKIQKYHLEDLRFGYYIAEKFSSRKR